METTTKGYVKISEYFGANLAELLAEKILPVYGSFDSDGFIQQVESSVPSLSYTKRVEIIADALHEFLPKGYKQAIQILLEIMGPENPNETGMFKFFYWLLPVGKFIEKYGLEDFDVSMQAISEL